MNLLDKLFKFNYGDVQVSIQYDFIEYIQPLQGTADTATSFIIKETEGNVFFVDREDIITDISQWRQFCIQGTLPHSDLNEYEDYNIDLDMDY